MEYTKLGNTGRDVSRICLGFGADELDATLVATLINVGALGNLQGGLSRMANLLTRYCLPVTLFPAL